MKFEEESIKEEGEEEATDYVVVSFKTNDSPTGLDNMCQYTVYCDNVYEHSLEAFLEAMKTESTEDDKAKSGDEARLMKV